MPYDSRRRTFTPEQHRAALLARRIKFVVEKGSMARLFPKGTHGSLQRQLVRVLQPSVITKLRTREAYDYWLIGRVELRCWEPYSHNGLHRDRWAYFAKLINIVTYEIVANRELCADQDWHRLMPFLHLPIDRSVLGELARLDPDFPPILALKGMTKDQYLRVQNRARTLAEALRVPRIWFEAAWSAT